VPRRLALAAAGSTCSPGHTRLKVTGATISTTVRAGALTELAQRGLARRTWRASRPLSTRRPYGDWSWTGFWNCRESARK